MKKKARIIFKILRIVLSAACIIISVYCWYKSLELYNLYTVHPDNQLFSWMPPLYATYLNIYSLTDMGATILFILINIKWFIRKVKKHYKECEQERLEKELKKRKQKDLTQKKISGDTFSCLR